MFEPLGFLGAFPLHPVLAPGRCGACNHILVHIRSLQVVVPAVRVAHDHGHIHVLEQRALPGRKVARDGVDAPRERAAEARRELEPQRIGVQRVAATPLLAVWQGDARAALRPLAREEGVHHARQVGTKQLAAAPLVLERVAVDVLGHIECLAEQEACDLRRLRGGVRGQRELAKLVLTDAAHATDERQHIV
eukprot:4942087-Prymnesium_polylepis.2